MSEIDWRVDMAKLLFGQRLVRKPYVAPSEEWDHDHCAACWQKLGPPDMAGAQQEGYATTDEYVHGAEYEWVCVTCFNDLREVMHWQEVEEG